MEQSRPPIACQIGGDGAVVDACYTLAGDKVATCSNSGAVQVWACSSSDPEWELLHVEELPEPATQLTWAHPENGLILAIGGKRGTVYILQAPAVQRVSSQQQQHQQQEEPGQHWRLSSKLACGQGPISAMAFAPRQFGLLLAAACHEQQTQAMQLGAAGSGGTVQLWEASGVNCSSMQWTQLSGVKLPRDAGRVRCMCWREAAVGLPPLLAVGHDSGGSIWAYQQTSMAWQALCRFAPSSGAQQPLLAVDWAPALGRPFELLAASYGDVVVLYKVVPAADSADGQIVQLEASVASELQHPDKVWKLEFNMLGNTLGCSLDGRPEVWFWMPPLDDGPWYAVSKIVGQEQQAVDADGDMLD